MKKYILVLLLLVFVIGQGMAQKKTKRDYIKSLKIAFMTDNLNLTTEEAQKFWPIYNNYEDHKYAEVYKEYKGIKHLLRDKEFGDVSEAQAKRTLEKLIDIKKNSLELEKKLFDDLSDIMPSTKILYLKKLEDDFNHKLLEKLKKEYHNKEEK
ncbi:hypothetical protein I215_14079 [Galbibacter marinus]|uniref:Sensor of ECF-type sigma factor n=1 Tax=Galbibacter marinus TaxID=555500 RepID=K2PNK1_9FLAO|nr:hypothetical protein [Galbibacter marinus]EKF54130.1 hypothetical protein I215_14079 [Galbibacter marinus]